MRKIADIAREQSIKAKFILEALQCVGIRKQMTEDSLLTEDEEVAALTFVKTSIITDPDIDIELPESPVITKPFKKSPFVRVPNMQQIWHECWPDLVFPLDERYTVQQELVGRWLSEKAYHPEYEYNPPGAVIARHHALGKYKIHVDLAFPKSKLAIEVDGLVHETSRQKIIDKARDEMLESLGWVTKRIANHLVFVDSYDLNCYELYPGCGLIKFGNEIIDLINERIGS